MIARFVALCLLLAPCMAAFAQSAADAAASGPPRQAVEAVASRLKGAPAAVIERAAAAFTEHLRATSRLAADQLAAGKMDPDDLSSRVEVFLAEHAELTGRPLVKARVDPRRRISTAMAGRPGAPGGDAERTALGDRFLADLARLSAGARDRLMSGEMPDDELAARVAVFLDNLEAEKHRVATDPAQAAAVPVVAAFEKANFGNAAERPDSVCYRGQVEEAGRTREFVIFEKRPEKIRIHIIENGLVIGILASDGSAAWRQSQGRPAQPMPLQQLRDYASLGLTHDPLYGSAERGAVVRLEEQRADALRLSVRERDGTVTELMIDPKTYEERVRRIRRPDGTSVELRRHDPRRIGPMVVAQTIEQYRDGLLVATTKIRDLSIDPGLLDRFFRAPGKPQFDFMDYMAGLAALRSRQVAAAGGTHR